ncbi:thioredoxin [Volvox carteri f. nagariensis]|uniref:Thioredoxin n=1 Tax=Volvox carteri f. nagariensis TaxID=3068 RepID=D8TQ67_VOLCA|nr:thioredoxin [Volvox carteri f. nagariensis]EFJ50351.1 thioredoxin [Volvox carteri f. nagariensis]|eukprot:XP_002948476.1 thioredoxin [Volvox carteri f. nagariensis]
MSAMLSTSTRAASGLRTGHTERACVPIMAVALPRKVMSARRVARTEKATLASMPVTADAVVAPPKIVHTITAEQYHDFLAEHSDKLVTMDFYAVWCGPCKMIAPELERMAAESDPSKLVFAKLDCGATNESKKLAMSLGIKALPTFHLYKNSKIVDTMTGAKVKSLADLINKHL